MTIRVDITHVKVEKLDKTQPQDTLYVAVRGEGVHELCPGQGGTFYVHKQNDIHLFYDRRSKDRRK